MGSLRTSSFILCLALVAPAGCHFGGGPEGWGDDTGDTESGEDSSEDSDPEETEESESDDDDTGETGDDDDDDDDDDDTGDTGDTGEDSEDTDIGPEELCPGPNKPKPCVNGMVDGFPCANVDLLSIMSGDDLQGGRVSDMWGWTYEGRNFAIVTHTKGTAFVEMTDPCNPVFLGMMPQSSSGDAIHHDAKTYLNYVYVTSEASDHGVQVFDLMNLLDVATPQNFEHAFHYTEFGKSHNMVTDPESGFGYGVGNGTCSGGLHIMDLRDPLNPQKAGCFGEAGYIHDAQCFTYRGPDTDHTDKEMCMTANGGSGKMSVVDMTDKAAPVELARVGYPSPAYTHQGWMTSDHQYFLLGDELDEGKASDKTRTMIYDMRDMDAPVLIAEHLGTTDATDHNMYVVEDRVYQGNYVSGLQILDTSKVADGILTEVANFDAAPNSSSGMGGTWSVYPYWWKARVVGISDMSQGLILVAPTKDLPE